MIRNFPAPAEARYGQSNEDATEPPYMVPSADPANYSIVRFMTLFSCAVMLTPSSTVPCATTLAIT